MASTISHSSFGHKYPIWGTGVTRFAVDKLMAQLDVLVELGNTIIVVEHDMGVIAGSDWAIDMGPGTGDEGGHGVASGTPD